MKFTFDETLYFTHVVYHYFTSDAEYGAFQNALMSNPERGDVMPGCGGLRKIRWRDPRRGKGTRGGLRIIYLHVPDYQRFLLLNVYDKNEADDLTREEKRVLAEMAQEYRDELHHSVERKGR